eukprot:jgi/Botrbrau1/18292/Bobra.0179s0023.1
MTVFQARHFSAVVCEGAEGPCLLHSILQDLGALVGRHGGNIGSNVIRSPQDFSIYAPRVCVGSFPVG